LFAVIDALKQELNHHAQRDAIAIELARLSLHFPRKEDRRSPAQSDLLLQDYLDDLSEFPLRAIQGACRKWRRGEKWWPRISELLPLVRARTEDMEVRLRLLNRLNRANLALGIEASQKTAVE
jgi:hypothetical protein